MKEIHLKVPLLNQPKGTPHCAVASMRMIMAYNGELLSHNQTLESFPEINKTRVGITPATARFLVESGYDVTYIMHQEELLLDGILEDKSEKDIEHIKGTLDSSDVDVKSREQWNQIYKLIETGGHFSTKLATLDNVNSYLERKIPVRIGVKSSIFYSDPEDKNNHAVVVIGRKNGEYLINDPAPKFTESYWIEKDKLQKAWRANGSLLLVATK